MATLDEIRLNQLLGNLEQPQGIATLSQAASPLAFRYTDQLYPQYGSADMGYAIGPYGSSDLGYAIGPYATPDSFLGSGFSGTPDMNFPSAPANRLGGLDLERFKGVSELGRQDADVAQVEALPGQKTKGQGIGGLLRFLMGLAVPGLGTVFNLATGGFDKLRGGFDKGLGSLRNLNQRLRATDFGSSRTLQEYLQKVRERKQAEKAQTAMPDVYKSAREQGFTNDRGGFSTNRADRAGTSLGSGQFSPSTSRGRSGY
jgi:hypothetical protein